MNKIKLLGAFLSLITASCSTTLTEELPEAKFATLQISVRSPELTEMTRAVVDAKDVLKAVDLALYSSDNQGNLTLYKSVSLDVTNTQACKLVLQDVAYGKYQILALGNASSYGGHATLTNPKDVYFENQMVPITFRAYQTLEVKALTQDLTLTLEPMVSSFRIYMKGAVPEGISSLLFEVTNAANHFDATTGLATADQVVPWSNTITIPADRVGTVNLNGRLNLYLTEADLSTGNSTVAIKVSALNSKNESLYSVNLQQVPLKIGSITSYTGNFFQDDEFGFSIQVDNTWGELSGTY